MRLRPDERRQQLTAAALDVLEDKGFAGLTLRDVAARAEVAHSLVRHHFGTRDALLSHAFEAAADQDDPTSGDADLTDPLAVLLELAEPPPRRHYLMWIDAWSEAPRAPDLLRTLRRHHLACQQLATDAMDRGAASGALPPLPDTAGAASLLIAGLDGLAVQYYVLGTLDTETHRKARLGLVERVLGLSGGALGVHASR